MVGGCKLAIGVTIRLLPVTHRCCYKLAIVWILSGIRVWALWLPS